MADNPPHHDRVPRFDLKLKSYEQYRFEIECWNTVTSIPKKQRGAAILFSLPESDQDEFKTKKLLISKLGPDELTSADGYAKVLQKLDDHLRRDVTRRLWESFVDFDKYSRDSGTSINAMKKAGVVLHTQEDRATIFGRNVNLCFTKSGHYCVPLVERPIKVIKVFESHLHKGMCKCHPRDSARPAAALPNDEQATLQLQQEVQMNSLQADLQIAKAKIADLQLRYENNSIREEIVEEQTKSHLLQEKLKEAVHKWTLIEKSETVEKETQAEISDPGQVNTEEIDIQTSTLRRGEGTVKVLESEESEEEPADKEESTNTDIALRSEAVDAEKLLDQVAFPCEEKSKGETDKGENLPEGQRLLRAAVCKNQAK
ncbi:Hypp669 [Branchiostoma lanceolatum]|uniref:Hypp669 protein n=1 Tax=Branchiostoma lanceolatum TaxID=7740 RepID=A0A8J9YPF8_BRALA|nr:Hypp669 [Branchiostoma lanceolatum]